MATKKNAKEFAIKLSDEYHNLNGEAQDIALEIAIDQGLHRAGIITTQQYIDGVNETLEHHHIPATYEDIMAHKDDLDGF